MANVFFIKRIGSEVEPCNVKECHADNCRYIKLDKGNHKNLIVLWYDTTDMNESYTVLIQKFESWAELIVSMLPNIVAALVVVFIFWLIGRSSRNGVRRISGRFTDSEAMRRLLGTFAFIFAFIVGIIIALEILNLGTAVTSLLAGAGIVGLAIGFAFQDLIANFIAGSMLAIRRPFQVGDLIETNNHVGTVIEINLRSTIIRAPQGEYVVIPNRDVFQTALVNYNADSTRRVDVVCGVSYNDDLEKVREIVLDVLRSLPARREDKEPECFFNEFGDSAINFKARFWVDFKKQPDYLAAQSEAIIALKKALDGAGVDIPFPIRTVYMRNE